MTEHFLKVNPQFWEGLVNGDITFQVRRNDRKFKVGDKLILERYDPSGIGYTGERVNHNVSYILTSEEMPVGIQAGYVVLGFSNRG